MVAPSVRPSVRVTYTRDDGRTAADVVNGRRRGVSPEWSCRSRGWPAGRAAVFFHPSPWPHGRRPREGHVDLRLQRRLGPWLDAGVTAALDVCDPSQPFSNLIFSANFVVIVMRNI